MTLFQGETNPDGDYPVVLEFATVLDTAMPYAQQPGFKRFQAPMNAEPPALPSPAVVSRSKLSSRRGGGQYAAPAVCGNDHVRVRQRPKLAATMQLASPYTVYSPDEPQLTT